MSIKTVLNHRNQDKRVIATVGNRGVRVVKLLHNVNVDKATFDYAIAFTDTEGNSAIDSGLVLNYSELGPLIRALSDAMERGEIVESISRAEWMKDRPKDKTPTTSGLWNA